MPFAVAEGCGCITPTSQAILAPSVTGSHFILILRPATTVIGFVSWYALLHLIMVLHTAILIMATLLWTVAIIAVFCCSLLLITYFVQLRNVYRVCMHGQSREGSSFMSATLVESYRCSVSQPRGAFKDASLNTPNHSQFP